MKSFELCKKNCYGCAACKMICPVNAITMLENEKGFLYPQIDESKCINCRMCLHVCSEQVKCFAPKQAYLAKIKDDELRKMSQSGGAFVAISDMILKCGGTVYGAILNDKFEVEHVRVISYDVRNKMRYSKYAQSDMNNVYYYIERDLEKRMVLFSGTPCQVAALRKYLYCKRKNTNNLYTIDLICHGVPSVKIWRDLIRYYENKEKAQVNTAIFRDKSAKGYTTFLIENKQITDFYHRKLYGSVLALRESCYVCEFAKMERVSDFTIGDAWGAEKYNPEFYDSKGISLVLLHTDKALKLFENVVAELHVKCVSIETYKQGNMESPSCPHRSVEEFWEDYTCRGFNYVIEKYAKNNIFLNHKYIFSRCLKKFIGSVYTTGKSERKRGHKNV